VKYILIVLTLISFSCGKIAEQKIEIKNTWIRNGSAGMNTALFFDVVNGGGEADTLYKAASDLAELTQIHETYMQGDMMGMREVENVVIEHNSTFNFKPGAHHVMLIKLKNDLAEGENGDVILYFKKTGEVKISAPVKKMKMN
jgi:periplasmic copper chaperone A